MEVSEAIGQQADLFLISIAVGAGLFFLYDILRIVRRIIPHGNAWIGIEDFLYWIICTGTVFVMLYRENDGMVRGFAIMGLMLGMALYFVMLSRYVVRLNVIIGKKIVKTMKTVGNFLFGPSIRLGKKVGCFLIKRLKKLIRAVRMGLCKL